MHCSLRKHGKLPQCFLIQKPPAYLIAGIDTQVPIQYDIGNTGLFVLIYESGSFVTCPYGIIEANHYKINDDEIIFNFTKQVLLKDMECKTMWFSEDNVQYYLRCDNLDPIPYRF